MTDLTQHVIAGYRIQSIEHDSPVVKAFCDSYLIKFGMPVGSVSRAERWYAVMDEDVPVAIFGERADAPTASMEVTDLYPLPGDRRGILACYAVLELFKTLLQAGLFNIIVTTVLAKNKAHQRALKRVFGEKAEPTAYVYIHQGVL